MPMIYKRFTEKSAEEWRQIYKVSLLHSIRTPMGLVIDSPGSPIARVLDQEWFRESH